MNVPSLGGQIIVPKSLEVDLNETDRLFDKFSQVIEQQWFFEGENRYLTQYGKVLNDASEICIKNNQKRYILKLNECKFLVTKMNIQKADSLKEREKIKKAMDQFQSEKDSTTVEIDKLLTRLSDIEFAVIFYSYRTCEKEKTNSALKNCNLRLKTQLERVFNLQKNEIGDCNTYLSQLSTISLDFDKEKDANKREQEKLSLFINRQAFPNPEEYCNNPVTLREIRAEQNQVSYCFLLRNVLKILSLKYFIKRFGILVQ